jgi:hypothetical protein
LYEALTSAVKAGLSSLENSKDLKATIKTTEKKGIDKTKGTSGTSALDLSCPPPSFKSFTPTAGYTGTIVQVTGSSLSTTSSVKIIGVEVPKKDITVFSDSMLRFIVPKIFTGEVNINGRIEVKTDHGTFIGAALFNYNPALNGVASLSPGGVTNENVINPVSSAPSPSNLVGTNSNPQNTKPITLIETENINGPNDTTLLLTVRVNPEAGIWRINTQPLINYRVVEMVTGPNNRYIEKQLSNENGVTLDGYVSKDQQEFSVTDKDLIKKLSLDNFGVKDIKTYITIGLYATSSDKVTNPQDVPLNYEFNVFLTDKKVGDLVIEEPSKITSITYLGDVDSNTQNGPQYYNIVKPGGGFKLFQLNVPTYNSQDLLRQEVVNSNNTSVSATFREGSDTKYTYNCTVNDLGTFKLKIGYRVNGVPTTIYGPPFTL